MFAVGGTAGMSVVSYPWKMAGRVALYGCACVVCGPPAGARPSVSLTNVVSRSMLYGEFSLIFKMLLLIPVPNCVSDRKNRSGRIAVLVSVNTPNSRGTFSVTGVSPVPFAPSPPIPPARNTIPLVSVMFTSFIPGNWSTLVGSSSPARNRFFFCRVKSCSSSTSSIAFLPAADAWRAFLELLRNFLSRKPMFPSASYLPMSPALCAAFFNAKNPFPRIPP